MAGSFSHIDDGGRFRMDLIENMGDAREALEDCHEMIMDLRRKLQSTCDHEKWVLKHVCHCCGKVRND